MTEEPYPDIVFEISVPFNRVATLISEASQNTSFLRIERNESGNSWKICRPDSTGSGEIGCELFVASRALSCDLYFSADNEKNSDRLFESVGLCLGVIFRGCEVLSPTMKRLTELPGLSDACSGRITTLLQSHESMTITDISKSLSIFEYTAAINLRNLLKKGNIGCTTPDVKPRKYFYR